MKLFAGFGAIAGQLRKGPGMVLLSPTSISNSGGSASVGTNGQVTFSAVTSLSLNGVFSATYDNYVVSVRKSQTVDTGVRARLRLSGTDATATNYTFQLLRADGTAVTAERFTTQDHVRVCGGGTSQRDGLTLYIYGPALAQPTAFRGIDVDSYINANLDDLAGTHSLSTSYDALTLYPASGSMTGALQVYGLRS